MLREEKGSERTNPKTFDLPCVSILAILGSVWRVFTAYPKNTLTRIHDICRRVSRSRASIVNVVRNPASDNQWLVLFCLSTVWRRGSAGIEFRVYTL